MFAHEMNDQQQVRMLEIITQSKAKIILSGYRNELYDKWLSGWETDATMSQTTSTAMAEEVIWMNYDPPLKQISFDC